MSAGTNDTPAIDFTEAASLVSSAKDAPAAPAIDFTEAANAVEREVANDAPGSPFDPDGTLRHKLYLDLLTDYERLDFRSEEAENIRGFLHEKARTTGDRAAKSYANKVDDVWASRYQADTIKAETDFLGHIVKKIEHTHENEAIELAELVTAYAAVMDTDVATYQLGRVKSIMEKRVANEKTKEKHAFYKKIREGEITTPGQKQAELYAMREKERPVQDFLDSIEDMPTDLRQKLMDEIIISSAEANARSHGSTQTALATPAIRLAGALASLYGRVTENESAKELGQFSIRQASLADYAKRRQNIDDYGEVLGGRVLNNYMSAVNTVADQALAAGNPFVRIGLTQITTAEEQYMESLASGRTEAQAAEDALILGTATAAAEGLFFGMGRGGVKTMNTRAFLRKVAKDGVGRTLWKTLKDENLEEIFSNEIDHYLRKERGLAQERSYSEVLSQLLDTAITTTMSVGLMSPTAIRHGLAAKKFAKAERQQFKTALLDERVAGLNMTTMYFTSTRKNAAGTDIYLTDELANLGDNPSRKDFNDVLRKHGFDGMRFTKGQRATAVRNAKKAVKRIEKGANSAKFSTAREIVRDELAEQGVQASGVSKYQSDSPTDYNDRLSKALDSVKDMSPRELVKRRSDVRHKDLVRKQKGKTALPTELARKEKIAGDLAVKRKQEELGEVARFVKDLEGQSSHGRSQADEVFKAMAFEPDPKDEERGITMVVPEARQHLRGLQRDHAGALPSRELPRVANQFNTGNGTSHVVKFSVSNGGGIGKIRLSGANADADVANVVDMLQESMLESGISNYEIVRDGWDFYVVTNSMYGADKQSRTSKGMAEVLDSTMSDVRDKLDDYVKRTGLEKAPGRKGEADGVTATFVVDNSDNRGGLFNSLNKPHVPPTPIDVSDFDVGDIYFRSEKGEPISAAEQAYLDLRRSGLTHEDILRKAPEVAAFLRDPGMPEMQGMEVFSKDGPRITEEHSGVYIEGDIGNLKGVTTKLGRQKADEHLRNYSAIISKRFRNIGAYLYRKGGDEIGIYAPGKTKEQIMPVLDKIVKDIADYEIKNKLTKIKHTKAKRKSGFGIAFAVAEFDEGSNNTAVENKAASLLEEVKDGEKNEYGKSSYDIRVGSLGRRIERTTTESDSESAELPRLPVSKAPRGGEVPRVSEAYAGETGSQAQSDGTLGQDDPSRSAGHESRGQGDVGTGQSETGRVVASSESGTAKTGTIADSLGVPANFQANLDAITSLGAEVPSGLIVLHDLVKKPSIFPYVDSITQIEGTPNYLIRAHNGAEAVIQYVPEVFDERGEPIAGSFQVVQGDAVITLTEFANKKTLDHEAFHWARRLGLVSDAEFDALRKRYAGKEADDYIAEEMVAEGLARDLNRNKIVDRIMGYFKDLYHSLAGDGSNRFINEWKAGEIWMREEAVGKRITTESLLGKERYAKMLDLRQKQDMLETLAQQYDDVDPAKAKAYRAAKYSVEMQKDLLNRDPGFFADLNNGHPQIPRSDRSFDNPPQYSHAGEDDAPLYSLAQGFAPKKDVTSEDTEKLSDMPDSGELIVLKPETLKSAEPVTYAPDGSIIPPSSRFDESSYDIMYSVRRDFKDLDDFLDMNDPEYNPKNRDIKVEGFERLYMRRAGTMKIGDEIHRDVIQIPNVQVEETKQKQGRFKRLMRYLIATRPTRKFSVNEVMNENLRSFLERVGFDRVDASYGGDPSYFLSPDTPVDLSFDKDEDSLPLYSRADGIPAYHGSITNILANLNKAARKFLLQHVGSGMGTLYGYGLYFTDREDIARVYADQGGVGGRNLYRVQLWRNKEADLIDWEGEVSDSQKKKVIEIMERELALPSPLSRVRASEQEAVGGFIDRIKAGTIRGYELYNSLVNIISFDPEYGERKLPQERDEYAYGQRRASALLQRAGIDGITYPEDDADGQNYVVFDENAVEIIEHELYSMNGEESDESRRMGIEARRGLLEQMREAYKHSPSHLHAIDQALAKLDAIEEAQPGKKFGRPELANPATSETGRAAMDALDEVLKQRGTPKKRSDVAVNKEADRLLAELPPEAMHSMVLEAAGMTPDGSRRTLVDAEVVAAKRYVGQLMDEAFSSDDPVKQALAAEAATAWRAYGTEQARAFRQRYDVVETPAERTRHAIMTMVFAPKDGRSGTEENALTDLDNANRDLQKAKDRISKLQNEIDRLNRELQKTKDAVANGEMTARDGEATSRPLRKKRNSKQTQLDGSKTAQTAAERAKSRAERRLLQLREGVAEDLGAAKEELAKLGYDGSAESIEKLSNTPIDAMKFLNAMNARSARLWSKLVEYWKSSILWGPQTHSANISGNTFYAGYQFTIGRAAEAAVNTFVKDPGAASFKELQYLWRGFFQGANWKLAGRLALDSFWSETDMLSYYHGGKEEHGKLSPGRAAIRGPVGKLIRLPFAALGAADVFARTITSRMEVAARAYRIAKEKLNEGEITQDQMAREIVTMVNDTNSDAWSLALDTSKELAFMKGAEDTDLGASMMQAAAMAKRGVPALEAILPFINTPMNVVYRGYRHSLLGLPAMAMKIHEAYKTGDWSEANVRIAEQILAVAATLMIAATNDEEDPWITGSQALDYGQRNVREMNYRAKAPASSIRLPFIKDDDGNDIWLNYGRIEPFATTLQLTVDTYQNIGSGPDLVGKLAGQFKDKSYLKGLGDVMRMVEKTSEGGVVEGTVYWGSTFASSFVPNIIRQPLREADPVLRDRRITGDTSWEKLESAGKRAVQKTEVGRAIFPDVPRLDYWGREIMKDAPGTNIPWRVLSPMALQSRVVHVGDRIILNYAEQNPDKAWFPAIPGRTFDYNKEELTMTDEEFNYFLRTAGERHSEVVKSLADAWGEEAIRKPTAYMIERIKNSRSKINRQVKRQVAIRKGLD